MISYGMFHHVFRFEKRFLLSQFNLACFKVIEFSFKNTLLMVYPFNFCGLFDKKYKPFDLTFLRKTGFSFC